MPGSSTFGCHVTTAGVSATAWTFSRFPLSLSPVIPSEDTSQVWGRQLLPITVVLSPCHLEFQHAQTTMCKPRAISDFNREGALALRPSREGEVLLPLCFTTRYVIR